MSDRILALRLFKRVARTGSLSACARERGLTRQAAAQILTTLQTEVGALLLTRSNRATILTDAGRDYLARITPILDAIDEGDHAIAALGDMRGILRVGVPASFAAREIVPRLPAFLARHPGLHIDLVLTDHLQHLITEAIDVALRFGALADSTAIARLIGTPRRLIAASPDYLARYGMPLAPTDLMRHALIQSGDESGAATWVFHRADARVPVTVAAKVTVGTHDAAAAAAMAGMGIFASNTWGCGTELDHGALVELLPDWQMGTQLAHAVFAPGRPAKRAARAFIDYLGEELHSLA